jgi:hypothetical protein
MDAEPRHAQRRHRRDGAARPIAPANATGWGFIEGRLVATVDGLIGGSLSLHASSFHAAV